MTENKQIREKQEQQEAEIDHKYLSGWGYRKDYQGQHYATSGNLGKMAGPNR